MCTHARWPIILAVAAAASLVGCTATTEVTVGQTPAEIDLGRCFGVGTVCPPSAAKRAPLLVPELRKCEATATRRTPIAWRIDLEGTLSGGLASLPNDPFAVARDGSVWVADLTDNGAFLAHYDANGRALGRTEAVFDHVPEFVHVGAVVLAVDSAARAYVGFTVTLAVERLGWREQQQLWLGRYAANADAIGGFARIEGVAGAGLLVSVGADDSLLVAAPGEEHVTTMGRFDAEGKLRWTQAGVRQIVFDLVAGGDGRATLLGNNPGPTPMSWTNSVAMYDQRGNLVWDLEPQSPVGGPLRLVAGLAGDLIMFGSQTFDAPEGVDAQLGMPVVDAVLHRIDSEGHVRWATRLVGRSDVDSVGTGLESVAPAIDAAGNVYVAAERRSIYIVNADGSDCIRLELDQAEWTIADIGVAADGAIFVALMGFGQQWSIARVQL